MRILGLFVIAVGFVSGGQAKASTWSSWSCSVRPRTAEEAGYLKKAPHGAQRLGRYELRVRWANGVHMFKDKPPYGTELGDSWFAYCGFHADVGLHMIAMTDGDTFTGELMEDATGKILPAGDRVWTSPDGQFYAATEQPDGLDGETAMLYTREGKLLWKGYSGVLAPDGQLITARFDAGAANDLGFGVKDGKTCLFGVDSTPGQPKRTFVLTQQADGKWVWVEQTEKPPAHVDKGELRVPVVH